MIQSTRPLVSQVDFGVEAIVPAQAGGAAASIPVITVARTIARRIPTPPVVPLREPVKRLAVARVPHKGEHGCFTQRLRGRLAARRGLGALPEIGGRAPHGDVAALEAQELVA